MDGVVTQASKGELKINLFHPGPPEMEAMDWNLYNGGSIGVFSENCSFPRNINSTVAIPFFQLPPMR